MVDNVIVEFLNELKDERDLDLVIVALLRAQGYSHIHLTHGHAEFGRDIIARRRIGGDWVQYSLQLKKGDVGQAAWREVALQCSDVLYIDDCIHPGYDPGLKRVVVLVLSGRLVGNAAPSAQQFRKSCVQKGADFEVWDREWLVSSLQKNLQLGGWARWERVGSLVEQARGGEVTLDQLERFSSDWLAQDRWSAFLEYCLLRDALRRRGLGLHAFRLLLGLVRKVAHHGEALADKEFDELNLTLQTEIRAFATPILDWFSQVQPEMRQYAVVDVGTMELVSCGSRLLLMMEIVTLHLVCQARREDLPRARSFFQYVLSLGATQRPLSDHYAVSILAVGIASHRLELDIQVWLRKVIKWLCDCYEGDGVGLAGPYSDPDEELWRTLGAPIERPDRTEVRDSLLAGAVMEVLTLLGLEELKADAINDFQAVKLFPWRLYPAQPETEMVLGQEGVHSYYFNLEQMADGIRLNEAEAIARGFDLKNASWIGLALAFLLRDRWWTFSNRQLLAGSAIQA